MEPELSSGQPVLSKRLQAPKLPADPSSFDFPTGMDAIPPSRKSLISEPRVFVSVSTECFAELPLEEAIQKLADLEYASIEIAVHEHQDQLKPSEVASNLSGAIARCGAKRRLNLVSYGLDIRADGEAYFEQFDACCQLAKATRIVALTVPSSPLGTPFNEEVERFKRMVKMADSHGVRVGMRSQHGCLSEDPDTVSVICDHVKGLALSFDPSQYLFRQNQPRDTERLMKYVHQVYLRDSSKDKLQVRVGQGVIEYGKLVNQLAKVGYNRSLCVHILPQDDVDQLAELRKMRLLLESLLV
jgi:sugar phosphate isomerase/epimerase